MAIKVAKEVKNIGMDYDNNMYSLLLVLEKKMGRLEAVFNCFLFLFIILKLKLKCESKN